MPQTSLRFPMLSSICMGAPPFHFSKVKLVLKICIANLLCQTIGSDWLQRRNFDFSLTLSICVLFAFIAALLGDLLTLWPFNYMPLVCNNRRDFVIMTLRHYDFLLIPVPICNFVWAYVQMQSTCVIIAAVFIDLVLFNVISILVFFIGHGTCQFLLRLNQISLSHSCLRWPVSSSEAYSSCDFTELSRGAIWCEYYICFSYSLCLAFTYVFCLLLLCSVEPFSHPRILCWNPNKASTMIIPENVFSVADSLKPFTVSESLLFVFFAEWSLQKW